MNRTEQAPFHYEGFKVINATPVPDDVFDVIAPELEEGELRVLLYIIRRTFGFKKQADDISLRQLVEGIRKKDGELLDRGAGVSKSTAVRAVKGLIDKGIITASRNSSAVRGDEPTTYTLRFQGTAASPVFHHRTRGCSTVELPRVSPQNTQHDRSQHDREQQHGRRRLARPDAGSRTATGLTDAQSGVPDNPILTGLLRLGMTRQSAARILRDHPADTVADWLSALPFIPNAKEPAAFLTQALKKNWALPQQYLQAQKKNELAKKKRATADAAVSAQVMADEARLERKVKVDAYLAVLDDDDRCALEAEAAARVREEDDGSYWKDRNIPAVLLKSCLRTIVAERMGLPPLDETMTSGEFTAMSSEVAR